MPTAKEEAIAALDKLPDDASFDDMQYRLHVLDKIRQGREDVEAGRILSHEAVKADLARWRGR